MKYYMQIEAFQFIDRSEECMASYPDWFHKAFAEGIIRPCGDGLHILDHKGINEHVDIGDYVVLDQFEESPEKGTIACVPREDFEIAFKPIGVVQ